jgi:DNA invertase Pin-like site-specific DNA recombinase
MKQVGYYLRTSHYLQNIGTQVDKIEDGWKVFKDEGVSGRISFQDRPSGKKLLQDVERGKISEVVVLRLDRLGRSTQNILETIKFIHQFHVPIRSLNEGITTLDDNGKETPMTNLLLNLLSSLSEFQYHQTREKTLDGILRGKLNGKYKGRQVGSVESVGKFLLKPKVKKIKELLDSGIGVRKISRIVDCSPNYIYKVKEKLELSI